MNIMPRLEISTQQLEPTLQSTLGPAESRALPELTALAPSYELPAEHDFHPAYAFANDECAALQFEAAEARQLTPDYRGASNRVAVVVGESSLAATLEWIPEETIVLLDSSSLMCNYMNDYTVWLQYASSLEDWRERIIKYPSTSSGLETQLKRWEKAGYEHALISEAGFQRAQELARQKVFVPWCADLTSSADVARLADALKGLNAHITFANLTNVIQFNHLHWNLRSFVDNLRQLPVTRFAPILTTSCLATAGKDPGLVATGPHFGLDALAAEDGQRSLTDRKAALARVRSRPALSAMYKEILDRSLGLAD
jgi:hypothetical protein